MAYAGADPSVWTYDVGSGEERWHTPLRTRNVYGIDFSPDGRHIVACGGAWNEKSEPPIGEIVLLRASDGRRLKTLRESDDTVWCARFSPEGSRLVVTLRPHVVVLDLESGDEIWRGQHTTARRLAWSSDGKWIASVSYNEDVADRNTLKLWNANTGECVQTISTDYTLLSVAISPDSRFVAAPLVGEVRHDVVLWEIPTGRLVQRLEGHMSLVWDMDFSPDGRRLATANWDGATRIWNVHTGSELLTLRNATLGVCAVEFSHNGQTLAVGEMVNTAPQNADIILYHTSRDTMP